MGKPPRLGGGTAFRLRWVGGRVCGFAAHAVLGNWGRRAYTTQATLATHLGFYERSNQYSY